MARQISPASACLTMKVSETLMPSVPRTATFTDTKPDVMAAESVEKIVFPKRKPGMLDRIGKRLAAISAMTATTCRAETLVPNQIGASTSATAGERVQDIEEIDAELRLIITKMK